MQFFRDKCHSCGEEHVVAWVQEACADLCEHCAGEFWQAFYRAESAAEGMDR